MIVTADALRTFGLVSLRRDPKRKNFTRKNGIFHALYGSSPAVVAAIWNNLQFLQGALSAKENTGKGMKHFLKAMY